MKYHLMAMAAGMVAWAVSAWLFMLAIGIVHLDTGWPRHGLAYISALQTLPLLAAAVVIPLLGAELVVDRERRDAQKAVQEELDEARR